MSNLLTVTDQMGREVTFSFPPRRIVSLVPSQTEFMVDIGVPVVGRTKFCIHPQPVIQDIQVIGGTKNFRFDKIQELQPDLIIGNKEENYKEGISALEKQFPVWISDVYTLSDAFEMMTSIGSFCDLKEQAASTIQACRQALDKVSNTRKGRVIYLIWQKPWMAAGKHTFVDHMLHHLGYDNAIDENRYPELDDQDIERLDPDHILFSSEPYPFKEEHLKYARNRWPNVNCQLIDGELCSWYGSRLRKWTN